MSLVRKHVRDAAIGVGGTPEDMAAIHRPGCAAVIRRRQPLRSFQSWIVAQPPEVLPRARVILRPEDVGAAVRHICDAPAHRRGRSGLGWRMT